MARDYFQDITPPEEHPRPEALGQKSYTPPLRSPADMSVSGDSDPDKVEHVPIRISGSSASNTGSDVGRGIRTIIPSRPMVTSRPLTDDMHARPPLPPRPGARPRKSSRWWLWIVAIVALLAVAALLLLAFRPTTITITPKSQIVTFNDSTQFTAYPAASAASGTLAYTLQSVDYEDSQSVPSQGVTSAESKASGSITVFNAYSAAPVKLIKNTRFQSHGGLIFRVPADVSVPGMKGSTPGEVRVTVIADQAGDTYNIAPAAHFTLPGLQSNAAMYAQVYASSNAPMTGGATGNTPTMAPGAEDAARSQIRTRLEAKANEFAATLRSENIIALPAQITYTSLPSTSETAGSATLHEKAHVDAMLLPIDSFAQMVGQSVSADAANAPMTLKPESDFAIAPKAGAVIGSDPIQFTLSGRALMIWKVDPLALTAALAGKDQTAFQTIVAGFPSIQEAHARIEPFWQTTFPAAASIKVTIVAPQAN